MNKNIVWSLLFVLAFIVGCDDENDPFAGNDNFITSFRSDRVNKFILLSSGEIQFYW